MDITIPITITHPQTSKQTPFGVQMSPGYEEQRTITLHLDAAAIAAIRAAVTEEEA